MQFIQISNVSVTDYMWYRFNKDKDKALDLRRLYRRECLESAIELLAAVHKNSELMNNTITYIHMYMSISFKSQTNFV